MVTVVAPEHQQRSTSWGEPPTVSSTGVPQLDELLGDGLHDGDNVVLIGDDRAVLQRFSPAVTDAPEPGARRFVVTSGRPPSGDGVAVIDARPRRPLADPLQ